MTTAIGHYLLCNKKYWFILNTTNGNLNWTFENTGVWKESFVLCRSRNFFIVLFHISKIILNILCNGQTFVRVHSL